MSDLLIQIGTDEEADINKEWAFNLYYDNRLWVTFLTNVLQYDSLEGYITEETCVKNYDKHDPNTDIPLAEVMFETSNWEEIKAITLIIGEGP